VTSLNPRHSARQTFNSREQKSIRMVSATVPLNESNSGYLQSQVIKYRPQATRHKSQVTTCVVPSSEITKGRARREEPWSPENGHLRSKPRTHLYTKL